MPNVNPYEPGDDIFQQMDLTRTQPIKAAQAIVKGEIYTKDSDGYIVAITGSGVLAPINDGAYQAKVNSAAVSGESDGDRNVQFLCPGAWMIMKAKGANITEGNRVEVESAGDTVEADTVDKMGTTLTTGFLGRVYQILTVSSDEERKLKTAADDLVIVQSGVL